MNQNVNIARYVNLFMSEASAMQLSARSSKDCIYVGVGREGSPAQLTAIPPRRAVVAPIEIGVHSTILGKQVTKLLGFFETTTVVRQPSRQEILRAFSIPDEVAAKIMEVGIQDDWLVFGLQNDAQGSSSTVAASQATSDSTRETITDRKSQ